MNVNKFRRLMFISASSVLLFACNNDDAEENTIDETIESPDDNENNDEDLEVIEDENGEETDDDDNENEGNDEDETDVSEEESEETGLSDIVSMNYEDREAHHRNLAVSEENLMDNVFEYLLLPGIHENTVYYEGRVGPGELVRIEFPDGETPSESTAVSPQVSSEGYFSVELSAYEFVAGDVITIRISGEYPQEQTFELPVHEAQDGMEEIRVVDREEPNSASETEVSEIDTLESLAYEYGVTVKEIRDWNGILSPANVEMGMILSVDGPNEEQAEKEEWQIEFEQDLYDNYDVTVSEYEDIGDGYYAVYVNEHDNGGLPYVTVDSNTGDYSS